MDLWFQIVGVLILKVLANVLELIWAMLLVQLWDVSATICIIAFIESCRLRKLEGNRYR